MQSFKFTSTVDDLLDAEDADMTERTGLRRSLRYAASTLAAVWALSGLLVVGLQRYGWAPFIWTLLGGLVVYYLVGRSYLSRRRIRLSNPPSADIVAEFRVDQMQIDVAGHGTYRREWDELVQFRNTAQGILLYFSDGTVNWLPARAFGSGEEKQSLVDLLGSKLVAS